MLLSLLSLSLLSSPSVRLVSIDGDVCTPGRMGGDGAATSAVAPPVVVAGGGGDGGGGDGSSVVEDDDENGGGGGERSVPMAACMAFCSQLDCEPYSPPPSNAGAGVAGVGEGGDRGGVAGGSQIRCHSTSMTSSMGAARSLEMCEIGPLSHRRVAPRCSSSTTALTCTTMLPGRVLDSTMFA